MMSALFTRLHSLNSAELSDALDAYGVEGALLYLKSHTLGIQLIGPAYTIKYQPYDSHPETFKNAGDYVDKVPAGSVIVIDNQGCEDCTVWGDILTHMARIKGIAGVVVNGAVRDIKLIRELQFPLFYRSVYMRSGKNRVYKSEEQCPIEINGVVIKPGDMMFADDNGVLAIPLHLLEEVIDKATNIHLTEQKIIESIYAGSTLAVARKKYHYHTPWVVQTTDERFDDQSA